MKNGFIITLIIILVIFVLGLTSLLISLLMNRGSSNYFNWGFHLGSFDKNNAKIIKEEEFDITDIKQFNIKSSSSDFYIHKSENEKLKVVQRSSLDLDAKEIFTSSLSNQTLTIEEQIKFRFFFFYIGNTQSFYDIYVPEGFMASMNLSSTSGNIIFDETIPATDIFANSTSGNIKFNSSMKCNSISANSTSGDITISSDMKITGNLSCNTVSGSITVQGNVNANDINLKTTSGSIRMHNPIQCTNAITLGSISGSIRSNALIDCSSAIISSTSGTLELQELQTKTTSNLKTTSGSIRLTSFIGAGDIKSTSGSISISHFYMHGASSMNTLSGSIRLKMDEKSNCDIYDKTTSGSVHIDNAIRRLGNEPYQTLNLKTTSGSIRVEKSE